MSTIRAARWKVNDSVHQFGIGRGKSIAIRAAPPDRRLLRMRGRNLFFA